MDSLAVEGVDRKLEVAMHSLTISSSLISSLWLIEAVVRPLYPGLAIFEKACGTTWGLCSNFSPATGYQLSLFGGLGTNCMFENLSGMSIITAMRKHSRLHD